MGAGSCIVLHIRTKFQGGAGLETYIYVRGEEARGVVNLNKARARCLPMIESMTVGKDVGEARFRCIEKFCVLI